MTREKRQSPDPLDALIAESFPKKASEPPEPPETPPAQAVLTEVPFPFPTQIPRTRDAAKILELMFCNMRPYSQSDLTVIAMARYDLAKTGKITSTLLRALGKIDKAWRYKDAQPSNALSVERGEPKQ